MPCWPVGCSQGTRGQQGPAAATTAGCSGSSGASPWEPAMGENPRSCWGGALLRPARGGHPTPGSVLLLLQPPLPLTGTGGAHRRLSCSSPTISLAPGWIQKWLPVRWGRAELLPMVWGAQREGTPTLVTDCHCSDAWGGGQAWHVRWQEGVPVPWRAVVSNPCLCSHGCMPPFAMQTPTKVKSRSPRACLWLLPPPCRPHPASVSPCVTLNQLPPPPASVSLCLSALWLCHQAGTCPRVGWLRASEVPR